MPTIVLLDVSLSMARPVPNISGEKRHSRQSLAISAINSLIDTISSNTKLEFISLVVFSSLWELVVPFTRDYDSIKARLVCIENYDKTCIETGLEGVRSIVMDEWGAGVPCQVFLVTDGLSGIGPNKLSSRLENIDGDTKFPLPYPFPCKIHVLCISALQESLDYAQTYKKMISMSNCKGDVYVPESLTTKGIQQAVTKLTDAHYQAYYGSLKCGNLQSTITLFPSPVNYAKSHDFEDVKKELSSDISICGFMDMNDVGSPCALSRHLVLPVSNSSDEDSSSKDVNKTEVTENGSDEDTSIANGDDGKIPNFCVLLHGSLKVEGMVAICEVGDGWYGMLYSWADTRKKSNLMLTIFEPGDSVPWVGSFKDLTVVSNFKTSPYGEKGDVSPFPVKKNIERRSYAQSCVVWIKQSGLQADIQKVLRHARKLPEKTQHFYRELNRVRKAALSFGFYSLLEGLSSILDRECTLLPGTAHPDAAIQLTYAANALRSPSGSDIKHTITALRTSFNDNDLKKE